MYDVMVQRRNEALIHKAAQSSAIVTSLFPGKLRERMLEESKSNKKASPRDLKSFLHKGDGKEVDEAEDKSLRPIAELYLDTTVMVRQSKPKTNTYARINGKR